ESSILPIRPDVMLIPMVWARRSRAWASATIATAGSVIGGVAGYAIGYYLFEYIGEPILNFYGYGEKYGQMQVLFEAWGPWILIAKGWTPFPYKVLTIAAGVFKMSLGPFILASIVSRAMRFYLVAGLLYAVGTPIRDFIEKHLALVTTALVALLVGAVIAIRQPFRAPRATAHEPTSSRF